jgi:hypothetical protein
MPNDEFDAIVHNGLGDGRGLVPIAFIVADRHDELAAEHTAACIYIFNRLPDAHLDLQAGFGTWTADRRRNADFDLCLSRDWQQPSDRRED